MPDGSRFAGLSPERRKLLEQLLSIKSPPRVATPPESIPATAREGDSKSACRVFFENINRQLNQTPFGEFSYFLNFGFVPNHNPQFSAVTLPEHTVNKNSAQLVLEVIGDCSLKSRRVLDVGCGRGGAAWVVHHFFKPRQYIGMDLSGEAIVFCRSHHGYPNAAFHQADAEHLPYPGQSIDVAVNIESSQSYPDIRAFYSEVLRVLAPQGWFLYTDVRPVQQMTQWIALLQSLGFQLARDRDITSNVLLSCDEVARRRTHAYAGAGDAALLDNFLGAPGSQVYEEMRAGRWQYRILKLQKAP